MQMLADYKQTDKEIKKSIKADPNDLSTIKENSVPDIVRNLDDKQEAYDVKLN